MKRLDRLIIRLFIGPLVLTFAIAVFVLLMQFIWKYVDDIAGKGLSIGVILELLLDASATFVPMALPIAVLFASIMTMGNLGEHYELVAIKSGGIPLWRAMMPMGLIVMAVTVGAFFFANNVMPTAVLKYRTTLYDITRKKPALNIKPGEYYTEIEGFVIRVNEKSPDGHELHDITVYDMRKNANHPDIVVARHGVMRTTPDERYLIFTLYNGCSYSENTQENKPDAAPFTRIYFSKNEMSFDLSAFAFDKSEENIFQGSYMLMNLSQLDSNLSTLYVKQEENEKKVYESVTMHNYSIANGNQRLDIYSVVDSLNPVVRHRVVSEARSHAECARSDYKMHSQTYLTQQEYINRHYIEWHRKLTLSIACIVLFLVGAPFGSIVRKGGLGLPLVASVVFFVLYYVVGMIAEKAVREGAIGPWGMWISTLVLLPIGLFLTYRAVKN